MQTQKGKPNSLKKGSPLTQSLFVLGPVTAAPVSTKEVFSWLPGVVVWGKQLLPFGGCGALEIDFKNQFLNLRSL